VAAAATGLPWLLAEVVAVARVPTWSASVAAALGSSVAPRCGRLCALGVWPHVYGDVAALGQPGQDPPGRRGHGCRLQRPRLLSRGRGMVPTLGLYQIVH